MKTEKPEWIFSSDSRDLKAYEAICREAAELGATYVTCGGLAEPTQSQWDDPKDSYCRYFVNTPSVFKFAESGVVKGVYSADHLRKNAELLAAKSRILRKYGLKGLWNGQESMWLPESFFQQHPTLRGPRIDHPARSLHKRYAPCIDQPEILDAYAGAVRRICEIAPAVAAFEFYTNDAGSGFCWCEFLYSGQNGPKGCRKVPMGKRVGNFLAAFVRGGKAAGRKVKVLMRPKHFSDMETRDYLEHLPEGAGMNYRILPVKMLTPFTLDYCLLPEWGEALRRRKRWFFVQFPGQGAHGVRGGIPCPFLLLETLREYNRQGVHGMTLLNAARMHASHRVLMKRYPAGLATDEQRASAIRKVAVEMYGRRLASAVVAFWRDTDMAQRAWPLHQVRFLFQCSHVERRMVFEPLMFSPEEVPVGPKELWHQGQVHVGPDRERTNMCWEKGTRNGPETWEGLSWLEPEFFEALGHLDRGLRTIRDAVGRRMPKALETEVNHVEIFRCLIATQGHKTKVQSLWGRLARLKSQRAGEADESRFHARRGLAMVMRREIANTKRLAELLGQYPDALDWTALEEASSSTGAGIVQKLRHKIRLMRLNLAAHAADA